MRGCEGVLKLVFECQVIRINPKDSGFFLKGTGIGIPTFSSVCNTLIPTAWADNRASVG